MLDSNVLGNALYTTATNFNDKQFDNLEDARLAFWKEVAGQIIEHFTSSGTVKVPALGFVSPSGGGPVTGEAAGTIS